MTLPTSLLLTQRHMTEVEEVTVPRRISYPGMLVADLQPCARKYRTRLNHGFKMGHQLLVLYDNEIPFHMREIPESRWHKKRGFCVGGDGRHVHTLMGDLYERGGRKRLAKEYVNVKCLLCLPHTVGLAIDCKLSLR